MKILTFFAFALLGMFPLSAFAFGLDEKVAECDNPSVLKTIDKRFDHAFLNKNTIAIEGIAKMHEHRFEAATTRSPIARRYCGAVATMSDGHERIMWYLIEDGMGLAGIHDNVEFCVSGLDPMRAYDGRCRVLK